MGRCPVSRKVSPALGRRACGVEHGQGEIQMQKQAREVQGAWTLPVYTVCMPPLPRANQTSLLPGDTQVNELSFLRVTNVKEGMLLRRAFRP